MIIRCSWPLEDLKPEQAKNRSSTECIDATVVQRLKGGRLDQAHLRKFSDTKSEVSISNDTLFDPFA